jgi:hypothetical protein
MIIYGRVNKLNSSTTPVEGSAGDLIMCYVIIHAINLFYLLPFPFHFCLFSNDVSRLTFKAISHDTHK